MYKIGETRLVSTRALGADGSIIITEEDACQCIELPLTCWTTLGKEFDNINEAVKQLLEKKYVKYFEHIGCGWYVSVTTGFRCVHLRKFYKSREGVLKPTREGIALRLNEWTRVCDLRNQPNEDMNLLLGIFPGVAGEENDNLFKFLQEYGADNSQLTNGE